MFGALAHPLVDLDQTFDVLIRVPWGPKAWCNVRSVEQRGFLAFALLPVAWALLRTAPPKWLKALLVVVVAGLGWHVAWATGGRLGYEVLLIASLPCPLWLRLKWQKGSALLVAGVAAAVAWGRGWLCDERYALMMGFVRRMSQAIWGGQVVGLPLRQLCS